MAVLQVNRGGSPGTQYPINNDRTTLGRHPGSDVVLDNIAVSRTHARILQESDLFFVEDLRSRNGTYVNGQPVETRRELADGDEIEICDIMFRFYLNEPPPTSVESPDGTRPTTQMPAVKGENEQLFRAGTVINDRLLTDEPSGSSSIVTTLQAGDSSNSWRLAIKPEAKLRAIISISRVLRQVLKLDDVLHSILEGLFTLFPQAEQGFIMLRDQGRDRMKLRATRVRHHKQAEVNVCMTIVRQALKSGEAILSADALEDSRFEMSESLTNLQIRSMMCVPLMGNNEERLGVLQLDTRNVREQFSQDDLDVLLAVATQASLAIENAALLERVVEQQAVARELEFAREIQRGFLPTRMPSAPGYEIAHYYKPAEQIGGDYLDCLDLKDGRMAIAVGDVAGKGIPAALLMARLYSAIQTNLHLDGDPVRTLEAINHEFTFDRSIFRFITLMIAILDRSTHELTVANAGHFPMLLCTPDGEIHRVGLHDAALPIGVVAEQEFKTATVPLPPGSRFVMYSDGITEAMNGERDLFGRVRLADQVAAHTGTAEQLIGRIIQAVDTFRGDLPQNDDSCLVAVQRLAE